MLSGFEKYSVKNLNEEKAINAYVYGLQLDIVREMHSIGKMTDDEYADNLQQLFDVLNKMH